MVKHENPYLSRVGSGTMVADGLSIINADFSSTSFRVSRTTIGAHNFLGNHIAYPRQSRTGDNCLLATKVMVPIDGKVRENVGLLGSPSFEIPRTVERDSRFDHLQERRRAAPPPRRQEQAQPASPWRCTCWCGGSTSSSHAARLWPPRTSTAQLGAVAVALASSSASLFSVVYCILVERAVARFRRLTAAVLLDLRPLLLVARALLEGGIPAFDRRLQRHPVQERDLAAAGCPARQAGLRRRLLHDGEDARHHRGRLHAQRRQHHPVPLAGGRRLQVRPHHHRCRLHARGRRLRPLRRDDGRRRGPRPRLLPDEGRGGPARAHWGGNPAREMPELAGHLQVTRNDHGRGESASDDSGPGDRGSADSGSGDGDPGDSSPGDSGKAASARHLARARRLVETTQGGKR